MLRGLGVEVLGNTLVDRLTPAAAAADAAAGCLVHLRPAGGGGEGAAEASTSGRELQADLVLWTAGSAPVTKAHKVRPPLASPTHPLILLGLRAADCPPPLCHHGSQA